MSIRIDEINVESVGPISDLQLSLGPFNLVYGRNEQGKTFLVEFVLRSLFKNLSGWPKPREVDSRGKVVISGLTDHPLSFRPTSRRKIEDYLAEIEPGLPTQISRLLIVKGAELDFDRAQGSGISRDVLKEFLSGQGTLDDVQRNISKTVMKAQVEDGQIVGANMGEIKTRNELSSRLKGIDELFEKLEIIYSGAERQTLGARTRKLKKAIDEQTVAKRFQGFQIHERIQTLKKRLDRLPQDELEQLTDDFKRLKDTQRRIGDQERKLAKSIQKSEHFPWLVAAIEVYEARAAEGKLSVSRSYPVAIIVALALAALLSFVGFPLGTFVLIVAALAIGSRYRRQYRLALERAADVDEIKRLESEFQSRFGQPLSGLPQMIELKKSMERDYHAAETLRGELDGEVQEDTLLCEQITSRLENITGANHAPDEWQSVIHKLNALREKTEDLLKHEEITLAALGILETEYRSEPTTVTYDKERLSLLETELQQTTEDLTERNNELNNLKQRISEVTRDDISTDFETLIHNLQRKREEVAAEYRKVTAAILAGILVNHQLNIIGDQEEEKIREKLNSQTVCRPIFAITGRYSSFNYVDGNVSVNDSYGQFRLADLSTGARDQVLLGLRIGFAAHTLRNDRLFLVLDDAFQHADWQRRECLLDQTLMLAKDGWQIIYFTMDDHIRELFNAAGQTHFPGQYCYHELKA